MPFYQTGTIKKKDISDEDIKVVQNLITKIKPHQIYAAGDLSDPHGTHRLCLRSIYRAIDNLKSKLFMKECCVWLYRGAWNEWKVYDIDMSVPLSPDQVLKKRRNGNIVINNHKSKNTSPHARLRGFHGHNKRKPETCGPRTILCVLQRACCRECVAIIRIDGWWI